MTVSPTNTEQSAIGIRAEAMLSELGAISSEPNRLIRLFLSDEHRRAADRIAGWMKDAGMTVSEDALGTVRGTWKPDGVTGKRRLLIGSHIDTVIDAGRYDGPLGVVVGILGTGGALEIVGNLWAGCRERAGSFDAMVSWDSAL